MNTYIVIGAPGMGKSPFVRTMIEGKRCLIADWQNEYGVRTKYPGQKPVGLSDNVNTERARYTGNDVDAFLKICEGKKNTIIVFEEATAFFTGKTEKNLRRFMINRYHTGNVSLFLFHSIQSVPPFMFSTSNYVVLFKTIDIEKNINAKLPRLLEPYQRLQQLPNGEKIIIKLI